MLILFFLAVALIVTVVYFFMAASSTVWKALLLFLGVFAAVNLAYLLVLLLASLFINQRQPLTRQNPLCRAGCAGVSSIALGYSLVRCHVTGAELLPENNRFVMVSNHRSGYDPLVILKKLEKYNIAMISKVSNMRLPIVGRVAYGAGFLSIDRENNRDAMKTILTAVDYIKRNLCSIAVYPEGTRTKTGEMGDFHAGSFKIAQKADVPLVISAISGTEKITKNIFRRITNVYLDILELVPAERVKAMSTRELSEYSKSVIAAHLRKTGAGA